MRAQVTSPKRLPPGVGDSRTARRVPGRTRLPRGGARGGRRNRHDRGRSGPNPPRPRRRPARRRRPGPRRRRVRGPCPERMDLGRREPQPEPGPARAPIVPRRRPRIHHSRPGRLTPGARPDRLTARSSPAAELRGGQDARGAAGPVLTHPATSAAGAEASAPAPAVEVAASAPGAYSGALTGEGDDPLLEQTAGPRGPAPAPPTRRPRSGHAAARRATIIQTTTAERGTATQDIPPAGTGRTSHYQSRSSRGRAPAQSLHPILPRLTPTPTIPPGASPVGADVICSSRAFKDE